MPNTRSAERRMRKERRRYLHNRSQRSRLKTAIRRVREAPDGATALAAYREMAAMLDRFATRRLIHPNKAARVKSRLARRLKELGVVP